MAWCLLKHTDNFTLLYFTYNTDICSKPVDKLQNWSIKIYNKNALSIMSSFDVIHAEKKLC
jgi:hypothetical protein